MRINWILYGNMYDEHVRKNSIAGWHFWFMHVFFLFGVDGGSGGDGAPHIFSVFQKEALYYTYVYNKYLFPLEQFFRTRQRKWTHTYRAEASKWNQFGSQAEIFRYVLKVVRKKSSLLVCFFVFFWLFGSVCMCAVAILSLLANKSSEWCVVHKLCWFSSFFYTHSFYLVVSVFPLHIKWAMKMCVRP